MGGGESGGVAAKALSRACNGRSDRMHTSQDHETIRRRRHSPPTHRHNATQRNRNATATTQPRQAAAPVKIVIQGRRLEVTPAIRDYVEEKVGRAAHHL